ncbi:MAG: CheR family methyltransferase [Pseudomonas sp.]|uniref:CheR family methyltransferase n=1 Tax=Pseudomonas sp. TaxID=306 RepID=UPI003396C62F
MTRLEPPCSARVRDVLVHKVHQHLGTDFSGARCTDLLRRLQLLALEQEVSAIGAWLEALAFAEWDERLVQELTPAFSVGETYFRRDAEAFDWLSQHYLQPLIARRREAGQRYLRLWSAACCTGEEAYSLLFLLDELLGGEGPAWTIELIASDINPQFLARAAQGCYGQNAFRRNDEGFRSRYFQAQDRGWQVRPEWLGRIRFIPYNLANGPLPNPGLRLAEVDLILCRNVLMYFSAERSAHALQRLLGCLTGEGLLLLSAVEAGLATQAGLCGFWAGSNYALKADARRRTRSPTALDGPPLPAAPRRVRRDALPPALRAAPQATAVLAPQVLPAACAAQERHWQLAQQAGAQGQPLRMRQSLLDYLACPGLSQHQRHLASLEMARSWADQQQGDEAQDWLQRALVLENTSATAYWLMALLAQQTRDSAAALLALQKALYLDPDLIMGHFLQAQLLREAGRLPASHKALLLCCRLLDKQAPEALLPLGDGLSGGQLQRLCEQQLEGLAACRSL